MRWAARERVERREADSGRSDGDGRCRTNRSGRVADAMRGAGSAGGDSGATEVALSVRDLRPGAGPSRPDDRAAGRQEPSAPQNPRTKKAAPKGGLSRI